MTKNKVIVRINGSEYTLTGDESEDYLFSIANYVDKKLRETLTTNCKHSNTSAAILTALTIVDELFKIRRENDYLKQRIGEPEEKYNNLKTQFESLKDTYTELQNEYNESKEFYEEITKSADELKEKNDNLSDELNEKNQDYETLIRENAYLKEQNSKLEQQAEKTKEEASNLKNELLENQIELVRIKKDFKEMRDIQIKRRSIT